MASDRQADAERLVSIYPLLAAYCRHDVFNGERTFLSPVLRPGMPCIWFEERTDA
jgi:hypothetical protein